MMDPFLPKEKFLPVAVCAVFRVELARAVFREKEMSLCLYPCGGIRRRRAAPHQGSIADSDKSASSLREGERIEVRGYHSPRHSTCDENPHPALSLAKGEANATCGALFAFNRVERKQPLVKILARRPPRPLKNSWAPGANTPSIQ